VLAQAVQLALGLGHILLHGLDAGGHLGQQVAHGVQDLALLGGVIQPQALHQALQVGGFFDQFHNAIPPSRGGNRPVNKRAGPAARAAGPASGQNQTRSIYSPVRVSMRMTSPSLMNRGTRRVAPVSTVAGFRVLVAVLPRMPGSVSVTVSSMKLGISTLNTLPL